VVPCCLRRRRRRRGLTPRSLTLLARWLLLRLSDTTQQRQPLVAVVRRRPSLLRSRTSQRDLVSLRQRAGGGGIVSLGRRVVCAEEEIGKLKKSARSTELSRGGGRRGARHDGMMG
jgi:hypothetical protein